MWNWANLEIWPKMVALFSWKSFKNGPVIAGVSMAPKFLGMNDLDGPVQFIRRLRLFDPAALR